MNAGYKLYEAMRVIVIFPVLERNNKTVLYFMTSRTMAQWQLHFEALQVTYEKMIT